MLPIAQRTSSSTKTSVYRNNFEVLKVKGELCTKDQSASVTSVVPVDAMMTEKFNVVVNTDGTVDTMSLPSDNSLMDSDEYAFRIY